MSVSRRASHAKRQPIASRISRRAVIRLLILGLLVYAIIAGFSGSNVSISALRSAEPGFVAAAAVAIAASYMCAALTYVLLSTKKIAYLPVLLVQISGGLVNRLLPAGLGGLGINLLFLKKRGYSIPAASAIVSINNFLGLVGNVLLLLGISIFFPFSFPAVNFPDISMPIPVVLAMILVVTGLYVARRPGVAHKISSAFHEAVLYVGGAVHRPGSLSAALLSSCALTALHAAAMFCVLQAVHADVAWPVALLAISLGALVGAALPTPGGLGGAEAGIVAALMAFSVPAAVAVAAALIYRGLTYWLPLLPGYIALRIVERRYL